MCRLHSIFSFHGSVQKCTKKGLSDNAVYPQYIVAYINNQCNILGVSHYFPTAPFYIILIFRTFYLMCKYGHQYIIISIPDTSAIIALSITFFIKLSSDCPSHNTTIYLYSIYGRPPVIFFCHNSPIVYSSSHSSNSSGSRR